MHRERLEGDVFTSFRGICRTRRLTFYEDGLLDYFPLKYGFLKNFLEVWAKVVTGYGSRDMSYSHVIIPKSSDLSWDNN